MSQSVLTTNLLGAGGVPPYSFVVVNDADTTITASVAGSNLTVDASSVIAGIYFVHVRISDTVANTFDIIIRVDVVNSLTFSILNSDTNYSVTSFPANTILPLVQNGGNGAVTWSLIPGITTLPGVLISQNQLVFSLQEFGSWTVGISAVDTLQNTVTKVITVSSVSPTAYSLINGHVELALNPDVTDVGNHTFTFSAQDSADRTVSKSFTYLISPSVATIDLNSASVEYFWGGTSDATSVVLPITGDLSGFNVGPLAPISAANGLTVSLSTTTDTIIVTGPPTSFSNSEVYLQIPILSNGNQVALVTRQYTLESHSSSTDFGTFTCNTKPYIVGELVGLDPVRPYFNSPSIVKNSNYTVRVQAGSNLPLGLSLDSVTGLIYGTIQSATIFSSILEYIDSSLVVHGTISINWDIVASSFVMTDNLLSGQLQASYTSTVTTSSSTPLTSATIYRGRVPQGILLSVTGTSILFSGTPSESGYFDIWIRCSNADDQVAYLYKRFVVTYAPPLSIITTSLPNLVTNQAYLSQLVAFGGVPPYTWSITGSNALPAGLTLNVNTGIISGTTSVTTYSQAITFQVIDTRGVTATSVLNLTINNSLRIITSVLPTVIPGQNYSYQMVGLGGITPYQWKLAAGSPILPTGLTLSSAGVISGVTSLEDYQENITISLQDTASTVVTQTYTLQIGEPDVILIDTSAVGSIPRGGPYQGTLRVDGTGTAPYIWAVTPDSPNPLPTGLVLTATSANQGTTATIGGSLTAKFSNLPVKISVVDSVGHIAYAYMFLTSFSALAIVTTSLPNGTVAGNYSAQMFANFYNAPVTWTATGLPGGYSISSPGLITGVASAISSSLATFTVTDSIGDSVSSQILLSVQNTTLALSANPPSIIAGIPYSYTLVATGGTPSYSFAVSPVSASGLPQGMTLNAGNGILSGTSSQVGFNQTITFRVTDSINNYVELPVNIKVIAGLTLFTGTDYTDGLSVGILGYVDNGNTQAINPNSNRSFMLVATGLIATSTSQITTSCSTSGFSLVIQSLSGGVGIFSISGNFAGGNLGFNPITFTVNDSGIVSIQQTFSWQVYNSGSLRLAPSSGTFPVIFLN